MTCDCDNTSSGCGTGNCDANNNCLIAYIDWT